MKSLTLFAQIQSLINNHILSTTQRNKLNLNDKAVFSEDLFGRIINTLSGHSFINANDDVANVDSIDLYDAETMSVLQITTIQKGFKAKKDKTIKGFLNNLAYASYVSLQILFLGPRDVPTVHLKKHSIRQGCSYEGLDTTKLLGKIKTARPEVKENILNILRQEEENPSPSGRPPVRFDIAEFKQRVQAGLDQFIKLKYFANTRKSQVPLFTDRKVKRHNREIAFDDQDLNTTDLNKVKKMEVVVGEFSSLIRSTQPSFLFGELGSGKSTIVTRYLQDENNLSGGINLLIPANFIKSKVGETAESILTLVSVHLKEQLIVTEEIHIRQLLTDHHVTIVFDGLDELRLSEAALLLKHLQTINNSYVNVTIIATGRPIELKPIIHLEEWNCLSVTDLSLAEVHELLVNEAKSAGLEEKEAMTDANKRLSFLKLRNDLMTLAVTPLVVTLIRDHLTADSADLSLGDLLYKVLKERLTWDENDMTTGANAFFAAYPQIYQRETFIARIAQGLADSNSNTISEEKLFRITDRFVGQEVINRIMVVSDAQEFIKKAFLQQMGNTYSFVSQPVFDTCLGVYIADNYSSIKADNKYIEDHWRAVSGAAAVIRAREEVNEARAWFREILKAYLTIPNHTTVSAIIVQELNDGVLAEDYIDLAEQIGYRPLRVWS